MICPRCKIRTSRPHDGDEECIAVLAARLQLATTREEMALRSHRALRDTVRRLKGRSVPGFSERLVKLETEHADLRQRFDVLNSQQNILMGELRGHRRVA